MRGFEHDLKSYVQAKSINLKEDILAGGSSSKRMVDIKVKVDSDIGNKGK